MTPIVAVIPTRFNISYLLNLLPSLTDTRMIYIMDNGLDKDSLSLLQQELLSEPSINDAMIIHCPELSIYQMWNLGWDAAIKDFGPKVHIAFLNDDIYFLPDTLSKLSQYLEQNMDVGAICPDYERAVKLGTASGLMLERTTSTFGHKGLAGFAFMVKGHLPVRVDWNLRWWYGDDDLVKEIEKLNLKVAKLIGLPVDHYQGTSYNYIRDELERQIELDRQYFNKKYGENRQRW
jgi:hypothetical protein